MKYRLIIFDMDGTILDTLRDLADSLNHALRKNGLPQRSLEEVRSFVGNGIRLLIERGVPAGTGPEAVDRVQGDFLKYYSLHKADKTGPYRGINELVSALRAAGLRTAVVSNKADAAVQALCRDYFPGMFDAAVGEREGLSRKPAPDPVFAVLKELAVKKDEALYVGDSEVDIETAENSGLDSAIVDWGFRDRELLLARGAKRIFTSPEELRDFILIS